MPDGLAKFVNDHYTKQKASGPVTPYEVADAYMEQVDPGKHSAKYREKLAGQIQPLLDDLRKSQT